MALANYTDLLASINGSGAWLHRTDLTAIAPDWVTLCETTINYGDLENLGVDGLRVAEMETLVTLTTVAGVQTVTLPTDFLEMRKIYYTFGGERVELREAPTLPMRTDERYNGFAPPRTFIVTGNTLYFFPIPDAVYSVSLLYYAKVGPLATSATNWLMTKAPMVYLAGSIVHGSPWLGPQFDVSKWGPMFKTAMGQVQRNDSRKRFNLTTLRSEAAQLQRRPFNILTGL